MSVQEECTPRPCAIFEHVSTEVSAFLDTNTFGLEVSKRTPTQSEQRVQVLQSSMSRVGEMPLELGSKTCMHEHAVYVAAYATC